MSLIQNDKYFIDQLNSSKAYQFMCMYHYSHIGFKKASLNLGIFKKDTQQLVGVLQWGCAAQTKIRLDRYVKEPIDIKEYLELNRFAMADSEGKNSESQAISLGIKWIKKNRPDIKLLVSYSGRIEGNYGYIYQATNWEYLGYFISKGFWQLDGKEYHLITVAYQYKKNKMEKEKMIDYLLRTYHDVRQYDSKQFIYIQRLNKKLTPAITPSPYPKPNTDFPIQTSITIYKEDEEYLQNNPIGKPAIKEFYYTPNERLFTTRCLKRHNIPCENLYQYLVYNKDGKFENIYNTVHEITQNIPAYKDSGIYSAVKNLNRYKDKYFRQIRTGENFPKSIEVNVLCWIDGRPFYKQKEITEYVGVTKQAVSACFKRKGKKIGGKEIIWNNNTE